MSSATEIRTVPAFSTEYEMVYALREEILRRPLGLSLRDEDLSSEAGDIILAAFSGDKVHGCLILSPRPEATFQLRQMAVSTAMQGRGLGRRLVLAAEQIAREHGYRRIILHARQTAVDFYTKLGYLASGDLFEEVGIPHLRMHKDLAETEG